MDSVEILKTSAKTKDASLMGAVWTRFVKTLCAVFSRGRADRQSCFRSLSHSSSVISAT